MPPSAGKHPGLRRLADKGRFKMVAIDRRTPLRGPIAATRGTAEAPCEDVVAVKERLAERLSPKASPMRLDPIYAFPRVLSVMDVRPGLVLSPEHSRVEDTPGGKLSRPALHDRMAGLVPKPRVLLSARAGAEDFRRSLTCAYRAGSNGCLCGRAIRQTAFAEFPDLAAMDRALVAEAVPYLDEINGLTDRLAVPWTGHPSFARDAAVAFAGPSFPEDCPAC